MAHATQYFYNPDEYFLDRDSLDPVFTTQEERRVILDIETSAAVSVGEPIRNCHACAKGVDVDSATYNLNLQKP